MFTSISSLSLVRLCWKSQISRKIRQNSTKKCTTVESKRRGKLLFNKFAIFILHIWWTVSGLVLLLKRISKKLPMKLDSAWCCGSSLSKCGSGSWSFAFNPGPRWVSWIWTWQQEYLDDARQLQKFREIFLEFRDVLHWCEISAKFKKILWNNLISFFNDHTSVYCCTWTKICKKIYCQNPLKCVTFLTCWKLKVTFYCNN